VTPRKQLQRSHKRRGSSNTGVGHLTHVPRRLESHHDPACEEELRKWQAEESQGRSRQRVLESVAKRLRSNPETLHLLGAFEKYTQQLRQGRAIRRMTWALELHNEKTLSTGEVWVHTHLMFDCLGTTVSLSRNSGLTFMNTYPHTSADCVKAQGRAVKKAFDQGHKTGRDILRGQCDPESKLFCEPRRSRNDGSRTRSRARQLPQSTSSANGTCKSNWRTWSTKRKRSGRGSSLP